MQWLVNEGLVADRRSGHMRYFRLNSENRAYEALKRLLDRIAAEYPSDVAAAEVNDDLKPARRIKEDKNTKKKRSI